MREDRTGRASRLETWVARLGTGCGPALPVIWLHYLDTVPYSGRGGFVFVLSTGITGRWSVFCCGCSSRSVCGDCGDAADIAEVLSSCVVP